MSPVQQGLRSRCSCRLVQALRHVRAIRTGQPASEVLRSLSTSAQSSQERRLLRRLAPAFREEQRWDAAAAALLTTSLAMLAAQQLSTEESETGCKASRTRNIHDHYRIIEKPIGSGGFGVVCVGSHRETGETVAIKQMPKRSVRQAKVMQEIEILRLAGEHRNIIAFKDLFMDDENYYIVMEMAEGGELFDRLVEEGAYSESQASRVMREIVEAIVYLHQQGIVHCDLKPENILLATKQHDTTNMRLVDFGSAFRADQARLVSRKGTGTVAYSAPEVINGDPCGPKADIWALGVLLFILLSGYHPFDPANNADDEEVGRRIVNAREKFITFDTPVWNHISPDAKVLIKRLLDPDPNKRPTAQELLNTPWIAGTSDLSSEPLEQSVENLRRFHRGRRRLKALMLAIMSGLANSTRDDDASSTGSGLPASKSHSLGGRSTTALGSRRSVTTGGGDVTVAASKKDVRAIMRKGHGSLGPRDSKAVPAELLGSRRAAVAMLDPENKGYITEKDLARVMAVLGEDLNDRELTEMLKSGDGDPHTRAQSITHQQLIKLLPALCPSKVFKRRELLYTEGEIDHTFYLLQKGDALLRFACPRDGYSQQDVPVERLKEGDSFGETEMMITADGSVLPRAASCECLSPRCEVIAIEDYLFSLLTDVFASTHDKLRDQAERRCRKILECWADNSTLGAKRSGTCGGMVWASDRRDSHRLLLVKEGFLEVESIVEDFEAQNKYCRVVKRYGPGTYVYTKGTVGHHEEVLRIRCLTDTKVLEIPAKPFDDFLRTSRKEGMMRFLMETQELKGRVSLVTSTPFDSVTSLRSRKPPPGGSSKPSAFGWRRFSDQVLGVEDLH